MIARNRKKHMYWIWMDKQAQHLSYLQKLAGSRMQSLEEWSCTFSLQKRALRKWKWDHRCDYHRWVYWQRYLLITWSSLKLVENNFSSSAEVFESCMFLVYYVLHTRRLAAAIKQRGVVIGHRLCKSKGPFLPSVRSDIEWHRAKKYAWKCRKLVLYERGGPYDMIQRIDIIVVPVQYRWYLIS